MLNHRRLTKTECQTLGSIAQAAGLVPVLRHLAGFVTLEHPDFAAGREFHALLIDVAQQLDHDTRGKPTEGA